MSDKYTNEGYENDPIVNLYPQLIVAAFNCALNSGQGRMRVGAILFRGKRIFCKGSNNYAKTHPVLAKYSAFPFVHAESSVLLHHGLANVRELDILVTRATRSNTLTMAYPCKACMAIMRDYGVKGVYYSDWKGHIRKCR